ncbi:MAG TPA: hypothetical protein VFE15_14700 [Marmoricola sp.]|jgi:hypothetical protein|nr:hypothetical protein [Marmoricola sp.]
MKELVSRMREPRSFRAYLLRMLITRSLALMAVGACLLIGQAMAVNTTSSPVQQPEPLPHWTAADATAFPGCSPLTSWPKGVVAPPLVVHRFSDGSTVRMPFGPAWDANHDGTDANDVLVLGICS